MVSLFTMGAHLRQVGRVRIVPKQHDRWWLLRTRGLHGSLSPLADRGDEPAHHLVLALFVREILIAQDGTQQSTVVSLDRMNLR